MSDALTKARAWINGTFVHEWDGLTMSERENSLASLLTQVRNETAAEKEQENKRLREALTNLLADAEYPRRSQSHIDAARAALQPPAIEGCAKHDS